MDTAFAAGYYEASIQPKADTVREVLDIHPEYTADEVDAYLNGRDDGLAGDTFRISMAQ